MSASPSGRGGSCQRRALLGATLAVASLLVFATAAQAGTINVVLAGSGTGTVQGGSGSNPPHEIDCSNVGQAPGPVCEASLGGFFSNVNLAATAGPGSTFAGWTVDPPFEGCPDGSIGSCGGFGFASPALRTVTATFEELLPPPTVTIEPPTGVGAREATFRGSVNPNGDATGWRFEYRPSGAPVWLSVPEPDGDAGDGETAEPVEATAEDLEPSTEYEVRLRAANATTAETSAVETFATLSVPPEVETGAARSISDTTATLVGTVDPNNAAVTACRFEYGAGSAFERSASCQPAPGSGGEPVQVTAEVEDLAPATEYRFRLVAVNECPLGCGETAGEAVSLLTYPAVTFPERGFELASAADTKGLGVSPAAVSADGDHLAYTSGLLPGAEHGQINGANFVSDRRPDGFWVQHYIAAPPPPERSGGNSAPLFSADLSLAVWSAPERFDPDDANAAEDVYARSTTGTLAWLSRDPAIPAGTPQTDGAHCGGPVYVSPDGSSVLFGCERQLLAEDVSSDTSLYELNDGQLRLVGVRPGSSEGFPLGSSLGSITNQRGTGGENLYGGDVTRNAVSVDGSRVVFQSGAGESSQRLFVRLGGVDTLEASASEGVAPPVTAPVSVNFWGADQDVESVFFTSGSALTADSDAPGRVIHPDTGAEPETGLRAAADLYRYSVPADGDPGNGRLVDLTPESIHPGEEGAGVLQVLDISDDGRRIHFIANGALTTESEPGDCRKSGGSLIVDLGECNLYLADLDGHDDDSAELTLVARGLFRLGAGSDSATFRGERTREVSASPDGSLFAFLSPTSLVPGRATGGHPQVYVYDAARGELACASCPGDGSAAPGPAGLTPSCCGGTTAVGQNGDVHFNARHVRNVVAGGAVFFHTPAALAAGDSNGERDVYGWRGGRVELVSTAGRFEAYFAGASADGSTVFLTSANPLAPGGQNAVGSVYAARVGGGYEPPAQTPECSGDGCRSALPPPTVRRGAGTGEFHGAGNLNRRDRACRRHLVRRRGRCVSIRKLARRACRKREGRAKRRCVRRRMRKPSRAQRRQRQRVNADRRTTR